MPYLNLDLDYFSHPKVMRLTAVLGQEAACFPIKLWCHVGKYHCATGMLEGYSKDEIESILGWAGEKGKLVEKFLTLEFLSSSEKGYVVHDWFDHAGHLAAFKKRAKTAAKKRWKKYATSIPSSNRKHQITNAPNLPNLPNLPNIEEKKKPLRATVVSDDDFWNSLRDSPAYRHVNLEVENSKMDIWLAQPEHKGRVKTRKFILNWLNKVPKPVVAHPAVKPAGHMKVVL